MNLKIYKILDNRVTRTCSSYSIYHCDLSFALILEEIFRDCFIITEEKEPFLPFEERKPLVYSKYEQISVQEFLKVIDNKNFAMRLVYNEIRFFFTGKFLDKLLKYDGGYENIDAYRFILKVLKEEIKL